MNMKELLLGTVVIGGLSSSAFGNDKELVGDVAMGVSDGDLCNLTTTTIAGRIRNLEFWHRAQCVLDAGVTQTTDAAMNSVKRR
jgi:hypothetical protein